MPMVAIGLSVGFIIRNIVDAASMLFTVEEIRSKASF